MNAPRSQYGLPEALSGLPRAIFIPTPGDPAIYVGTPVEMIGQMAGEMTDEPIPVRQVIEILMVALIQTRKVQIGVMADSDEEMAALFIYALLDRQIARPMPEA
jgi:hypothetical protein